MNKFLRGVPLKNRIIFIKQLSVLMRSGMPLLTALQMLQKQSASKPMIAIMGQVIGDVENGQYLSNALGKFKNIFGELTINIIAIGEISGNLSVNLEHLAQTLKKQQALRRKIISASVYPIFIIIATFGITVMLTVFIFPKIIPVFKSIHYQLPWSTRLLIFVNASVQKYGLFIALALVVVVIGVWFLLQKEKARFWFDTALMRIPFISRLVQTYNTANICQTLGLLLNSGVTVVRAFHICADTTKNLAYKKELSLIEEKIAQGEIISANISKNPALFPLQVSQMIQVGEGTGKLSETFSYLADTYEEEMDELTKNLSTTIEPLLLIFMGILVGFIAISIITPIYGITQHLTPK